MMARVAPEVWIAHEMQKVWFGPEPAKNFNKLFTRMLIWAIWDMTGGMVINSVKTMW